MLKNCVSVESMLPRDTEIPSVQGKSYRYEYSVIFT